jgi:Domain of unknown function (DUF1906)
MRSFGMFLLAGPLFVCGFLALVVASSPRASGSKTYLGFDANEYPGDEALPILRKTFSFTSYWIGPPPEEKASTWLGKHAVLQSQGFGFVVLWNGRESRSLESPSDAQEKGKVDGQNAAKAAREEGFAAGTVIFLDIEEGGRLSPAYHDYVHEWIDTLTHEKFQAGVYCSAMPVHEGGGVTITTANDLQNQLAGRKLVFWVFNDACAPSPGCAFPQTSLAPAEGGFDRASVWQYAQSPRRKQFTAHCATKYARDGNCYAPEDVAHKWFIDLNVADSPNPSTPQN